MYTKTVWLQDQFLSILVYSEQAWLPHWKVQIGKCVFSQDPTSARIESTSLRRAVELHWRSATVLIVQEYPEDHRFWPVRHNCAVPQVWTVLNTSVVSLTSFWVNYNISLTWIKAIWGWFPLLTMIIVRSQWGRYNLPRSLRLLIQLRIPKTQLTQHRTAASGQDDCTISSPGSWLINCRPIPKWLGAFHSHRQKFVDPVLSLVLESPQKSEIASYILDQLLCQIPPVGGNPPAVAFAPRLVPQPVVGRRPAPQGEKLWQMLPRWDV